MGLYITHCPTHEGLPKRPFDSNQEQGGLWPSSVGQAIKPLRMHVAFIKNASARLPLDYAQTGAQDPTFEQVTDVN